MEFFDCGSVALKHLVIGISLDFHWEIETMGHKLQARKLLHNNENVCGKFFKQGFFLLSFLNSLTNLKSLSLWHNLIFCQLTDLFSELMNEIFQRHVLDFLASLQKS